MILDLLRAVREGQQVSMTELARRAGMDLAQLSRIESGREVTLTTARRLAVALEVPVGHLISVAAPAASGQEIGRIVAQEMKR